MKYLLKISVMLVFCATAAGDVARLGDVTRSDDVVIAVKADRVETVSDGVIQNGVIVIRNGRIEAVGADVKIPDGAEVIEAPDKTVFPGIVNPFSRAGLSSGRRDSNVRYRIIDELYPHQDIYEKILQTGFTTLALVPAGPSVAGQGAIVRPLGKSNEDMIVIESGLLLITFQADSSSKSKLKSSFESGLEQADSTDPKVAPLAAAAKGELPVFIRSNSPADTLHLLEVIEPFDKANITLLCGPENVHVAKQISEKKLSVLLPARLDTVPYTKERINVPATLAKAEIEIACYPVSDSLAGHQDYLRQMAMLVKTGLDRDIAKKAITLQPARMIGLEYRLGSIEVGKDANLLILSGDALDVDTKIHRIILEGKTVYRVP